MKTKILTLPGYLGSDSEHWQTYWESEFENIARVEQDDCVIDLRTCMDVRQQSLVEIEVLEFTSMK